MKLINLSNYDANTPQNIGGGNSRALIEKIYTSFGASLRFYAVLLFFVCVGAGQIWADTWLYGSFQSWVPKDDNYKFTYDGSVGNCYLELEANTEYEFKIIDGDNYYSYTNQNFTTTTTDYIIYTNNQNCKITTGEAGVYIFKTWWADNQRHMAVYFPQARLKKGSYLYVDARNTNWVNNNGDGFGARYFYKYYDSGTDLPTETGRLDCTTPLEYEVHYTIVPDNDYVGQVQIERKNKTDMDGERWDWANNIAAYSRTSSKQNCLSMENATEGTWRDFNPVWSTYCPIKATSSISDNGTVKTWGGAGTSESPYYVATGSKIKVSSYSTDHISDANMTTKYDFEVRNASDVQQTHSDGETTTYEYTVPATSDVVYKVRVNSYNYYNSTSSTDKWSSDIYYKARTPYTISYNAGTGGSGERASETKLKDVAFALPNSAIFTRTGYTQTGWTKSNLGSQTHALGANYTDNSDQAFYPAWTPNPYTITLNNHDATSAGTSGVNVTFDANTNLTSAITIPKKTGYGFQGYYTEESGAGTQIIDAEGNFIAGAGSNAYLDGSKNWKHADNITLHAYWVASAVTTPTVTASMPAYIGEDITITLSATSTNVAEPVVIFEVADNSNSTTYEVVATPGAKGSMPTYSTTHTASFTAKHAATYSVTAKVYSGKLIDNFDGALAHWKALDGGTFNASATNPAMQAANGSNTVMKITRGDANWKTVQTKEAANDESTTNWNLDYGYIYISMYSTFPRATKMKYSDQYESAAEVTSDELPANTWTRVHFARASADHQIDYILPFMLWDGDMWIDDIILSNDELTDQATSDETSATIYQATISTPSVVADSAYYLGEPVAIRLNTVSTGVKEPVVMFYVSDGTGTYQVLAAPGSVGEAATEYSTAHSATFYATKAASYTAYAVLYEGKFIDNFEDMASAWSGLGYGTCARVANIEREPANGSNKVMKIMRNTAANSEVFNTAWTTTTENSGIQSGWNFSYSYIHMRYYAPQPETPTVEYYDRDGVHRNTSVSAVSANTWHRLTFEVNGGVVDHIHPFVSSGVGNSIYIDDIVLSNEEEMTAILTSGSSAVTIKRPFVIYRTGDKADDPRKADDDVESYDGGTIDKLIEYRMKVRACDQWYTLCLPFDVQAVQVWDAEDGKYYDLVPFYRTGSTFYTGHYIIRYPNKTTDFELSDFDNWKDPSSPTDYVPAKNTPYIIQWHDSYFSNRYVSFFGATGQEIPDEFSPCDAPSSDNVVNVCTNNTMHTGSVAGAYLLEGDYGGGAWLRLDDASASRAIPPFECYLLANSATRALYKAIQRGMVPTAIEAVCTQPSEVRKVMINGKLFIIRDNKMYNVMGMEVQK